MSNKVSYDTIQSQLDGLQQQINDIESGVIQIDYQQNNYVALASDTIDPKTGLYNGTQAQIIDKYISNTANINGSKIADNTITNSKLMSIDGSKIIDGTITSQQISNGTIQNIDIAGNANIDQNKILNLQTDLSNINLNITTLQSYFNASKLKLSNLEASTNNYQVLSQDSSANPPSYRQIDSNYISSLNQSKINMNTNNQFVRYCDSLNFNNITTFINSLPSAYTAIIYPFNNTGGSYTITNNDTWQAINCSIQGVYKSINASNVNIDTFSNNNTLNIGNATNVFGQYYSNLNFNCIVNLRIFLNGYFENSNFFKQINLTVAANSFMIFYNCTFNATFNVSNIGTGSTVFIINCNFTNKTWTQTTNSGAILLSNCSNLPSFTLLTGWFLSGYNGTQTQSRLNLSDKAFYDPSTNQKYLYTSSDIASLNLSQINVNSGLNMSTNLITCTASNSAIASSSTNLITKSYADATYSGAVNILPLNNTFTGTNTFNNSVFIQDAVSNNNPVSFSQLVLNTMLQSNLSLQGLPYMNSVSFWFDMNDRSLMYINQNGSIDTTEKVGNINNKQPSSFNYSFTNTLGGAKWPSLMSGSFGINIMNYINFNATIGQTMMLVAGSWAYDNASLQQFAGFIVFRPLNSTINGQILFSADYGTSSTRINAKFLSSSGRNGWTDTSQVYVAINCGTVQGAFSNGWYALTNGPTNTAANAIRLSNIVNRMCILFFSYTMAPITMNNLNKSSYCMNARFSCPSAGIPIDTQATTGNISCQYQDAVNGWFNIGALCANPMTNTLNQEGSFDLMEIVIFNAPITNTQRINVTNYLATKWNIV